MRIIASDQKRRRVGILPIIAGLAFLLSSFCTRAQDDYTTTTISGTNLTIAGVFILGTNGVGNQLVISDGGQLQDNSGIIGSNSLASFNEAFIRGSGSVWSSSANLFVGYYGSYNEMTAQWNGLVQADQVYVGYNGRFNKMWIQDGGLVSNRVGYVGYTANSGSGYISLSDTGSIWNNSSDLYIGYNGKSNSLIVSSGAVLRNAIGYLGYTSTSGYNHVKVSDAGTVWENSSLYVGYEGPANSLIVTNGAHLLANYGSVGYSSDNNTARVSGVGSIWTNRTALIVGNSGDGNFVAITGGALLFSSGGVVGDCRMVWYQPGGYYLYYAGSHNSLLLSGTASVWSSSGSLTVGRLSYCNRLIITNGAQVRASDTTIGLTIDGTAGWIYSNEVVVAGDSSVLAGGTDLYVGRWGRWNRLMIRSGGVVWNTNGYIGTLSGVFGSSNTVWVSGAGSVWSNLAALYIGHSSSNNQLIVENSAQVYAVDGTLGFNSSAGANSVLVSGSNSVWETSGSLILGAAGGGNQLVTSNGARVLFGTCILAGNTSSRGNSALVSGSSSIWVGNGVYIGNAGPSNQLTISDGGALLSSAYFELGVSATSSNNVLLVTGQDSALIVDNGSMYIGHSGRGNRLTISNGASVGNAGGYIGFDSSSSNNVVLLTGTGSVWSNAFLYLGYSGPRNLLTVTNGAVLRSAYGLIGSETSSRNNTAVVTGAGSIWSNTSDLSVGSLGSSNRLCIIKGGITFADRAYVGGFGLDNAIFLDNGILVASLLTVENTGLLTGNGSITGQVLNQGTLVANGGTLRVFGAVTNSGCLRAVNGGVAEFFATVYNTGTTDFSGGDALFHALFLGPANPTNAWVSDSDGLWREAAHWSLGVAPADTQTYLLITNANTKTVLVDAQTPSLAPRSLTNWLTLVAAPAGSTNTLQIESAAWAMANVVLGDGGRLVVTNTTATVGVLGMGALQVDGELSLNGGTLDASAVPVALGGNGTGRVYFANGLLRSRACSINGATAGATATVSGGGLWEFQGHLYVGSNSSANTLVVGDGIQMEAGNHAVRIGYEPASSNNTVLVSGAGTVWTNAGQVSVGFSGPGNQLLITDGAAVFSMETMIGHNSVGSSNVVLLSGPGSTWSNSWDLFIGYGASANQLRIADGASVFARNVFVGFTAAALHNLLCLSNGTLIVSSLTVSNGNSFAGYGTLNGTVANAGTLQIEGGLLTISGSLTNSGTITLRDHLWIGDDFHAASSAGSLCTRITGPNTCFALTTANAAALDGNLSVDLDGHTPRAGETFSVVLAGTVTGGFATTNLPALWPGLGWQLVYSPTSAVLSVTGRVQFVSYDVFAGYYNLGAGSELEDPNHNGIPNLMEFALGYDPTSGVYRAATTPGQSNGWFQLRFGRNTDAGDLSYFVEAANVLSGTGDWSCILSNLNGGGWLGPAAWSESAVTEGVAEVTVTDIAPAATNRFLRLRVTRP